MTVLLSVHRRKAVIISESEKRIVAYHEAGHAIIGYYAENADMVHKVTIVPRGRAGGYVMMLPKEGEDRMMQTKNELLDKVTGLLGGRVSEELFIGEIGTGAYSDFQKATGIVRRMIMEYGMSDKLGPMQFGSSQGQVFLAAISDMSRTTVMRLLMRSIKRCKALFALVMNVLVRFLRSMRIRFISLPKRCLRKKHWIKTKSSSFWKKANLNASADDEDVKVNIQGQSQASESNKLEFDKDKEVTEIKPDQTEE